jgi:hypothetical protein
LLRPDHATGSPFEPWPLSQHRNSRVCRSDAERVQMVWRSSGKEIFLPAVLSSAMLHAQNLPSAATCRQCLALEAAYGPWPASLRAWARMDLTIDLILIRSYLATAWHAGIVIASHLRLVLRSPRRRLCIDLVWSGGVPSDFSRYDQADGTAGGSCNEATVCGFRCFRTVTAWARRRRRPGPGARARPQRPDRF